VPESAAVFARRWQQEGAGDQVGLETLPVDGSEAPDSGFQPHHQELAQVAEDLDVLVDDLSFFCRGDADQMGELEQPSLWPAQRPKGCGRSGL